MLESSQQTNAAERHEMFRKLIFSIQPYRKRQFYFRSSSLYHVHYQDLFFNRGPKFIPTTKGNPFYLKGDLKKFSQCLDVKAKFFEAPLEEDSSFKKISSDK